MKFTILLDSYLSWSFILYLGELPIRMFWLTVLKISLLLKKCMQIINVTEKSHFMAILEVVIWKRAIRYVQGSIMFSPSSEIIFIIIYFVHRFYYIFSFIWNYFHYNLELFGRTCKELDTVFLILLCILYTCTIIVSSKLTFCFLVPNPNISFS